MVFFIRWRGRCAKWLACRGESAPAENDDCAGGPINRPSSLRQRHSLRAVLGSGKSSATGRRIYRPMECHSRRVAIARSAAEVCRVAASLPRTRSRHFLCALRLQFEGHAQPRRRRQIRRHERRPHLPRISVQVQRADSQLHARGLHRVRREDAGLRNRGVR